MRTPPTPHGPHVTTTKSHNPRLILSGGATVVKGDIASSALGITSAASLPTSLSLALLLLLSMVSSSRASEVVVGAAANGGWRIPSSETAYTLNAWAESSRFQIGDALVFKYDAAQDSVLQVTRADYLSCSASSPVARYVNKGGEAKVELERSGPYYFISGGPGPLREGPEVDCRRVVAQECLRQSELSGSCSCSGGSTRGRRWLRPVGQRDWASRWVWAWRRARCWGSTAWACFELKMQDFRFVWG
ncbi:hypothetical protein NL676_034291 [Syzygium grande]|nr:hypothetical protein NL676_034291 [Syzygium grande]